MAPMRGVKVLGGVALLAGFVASCSAFGEDAEPVPSGTDASADAGTEASANDGGGGPGCDALPKENLLFCADFDGVDAFAGWDKLDGQDPWAKYEVSSDARSAPSAAKLSITGGLGSASPDARLRAALATSPARRFAVTWWMKFQGGAAEDGYFMALQWEGAGLVGLRTDGRALESIISGGGAASYAPKLAPKSLPRGQWISMRLEIDLDVHELALTMADGLQQKASFDAAKDALPLLLFGPAEPKPEPAQPWEILYDDIVVTAL